MYNIQSYTIRTCIRIMIQVSIQVLQHLNNLIYVPDIQVKGKGLIDGGPHLQCMRCDLWSAELLQNLHTVKKLLLTLLSVLNINWKSDHTYKMIENAVKP